jgi:arginine deiminase
MEININSEIGHLEGVVIHTPNIELERVAPTNIHDALYNDLLDLSIARREYHLFKSVLGKVAKTFEITDLLEEILTDENTKYQIVSSICKNEKIDSFTETFLQLSAKDLATALIAGFQMPDNESDFLLKPLYNMFFTRDASSSVGNNVLINQMTFSVRNRESFIMDAIFRHKKDFNTKCICFQDSNATIEGGDVLVAREDVLLVGVGARTNMQAINHLIELAKQGMFPQNIVIQELPQSPASFIHLDMIFTFLDKGYCMAYLPLITKTSSFKTTHIKIDSQKVTYSEKPTLLNALQDLKFDLQAISCGNPDNLWTQQREQWHSGANFFALSPGKVLGYARNNHTLEQLNKHGFEIINAEDIVNNKKNIEDYTNCAVVVDSNELPRGGGGARCMTMPIRRKNVSW